VAELRIQRLGEAVVEGDPGAAEVIAKAMAFVAQSGFDLGPVVSCRHITKASLGELVRQADPSDPAYATGVGLSATWRDRWVVLFARRVPDGVVECPATTCVQVFDDTGEVELA
jgi:hypothetical protein